MATKKNPTKRETNARPAKAATLAKGAKAGKSDPAASEAAFSRAAHVQAGLAALAQRIRVRDQAAAKKLEPVLESLASAYQKLVGNA